jgi:hypothetical protein
MTSSKHIGLVIFATVACGLLALSACGQTGPMGANRTGEQDAAAANLPEIHPALPQVPSIPPPRHPLQYDDGTWSVYGLRKRAATNMDEEVRVKAYIVKIFTPEPCPEGQTCPPPPMPHLWLGDDLDETAESHLLRVVGYATSQAEIQMARDEAAKNKTLSRAEILEKIGGELPIVWDWQQSKQYIVKGRFTRFAGTGFGDQNGLLEYIDYQCLDCPPPEDAGAGQ